MFRNRMLWSVALVTLGVALGYFAASSGTQKALGQAAGAGAAAGPKYTVVETDILSALVVDNSTNTVYFYTTEPNAEPGADLHLRGSLDLNQVGQPMLKPKKAGGAGAPGAPVPKPATPEK
jgi:outer membrane scaffolding protein for murein synthesis (MipA/OmpV family)